MKKNNQGAFKIFYVCLDITYDVYYFSCENVAVR